MAAAVAIRKLQLHNKLSYTLAIVPVCVCILYSARQTGCWEPRSRESIDERDVNEREPICGARGAKESRYGVGCKC